MDNKELKKALKQGMKLTRKDNPLQYISLEPIYKITMKDDSVVEIKDKVINLSSTNIQPSKIKTIETSDYDTKVENVEYIFCSQGSKSILAKLKNGKEVIYNLSVDDLDDLI